MIKNIFLTGLLLLGTMGFAQTTYTLDVATTLANNSIAPNGGTLTLIFKRTSGPAIPGVADTFTLPVTYSKMNNTTGTGAVNQWELLSGGAGNVYIVPKVDKNSGGIFHKLPNKNKKHLTFSTSTPDASNVDKVFNHYIGNGTIDKLGNFSIGFGNFPSTFPEGVSVVNEKLQVHQVGNMQLQQQNNRIYNGFFLKPDAQTDLATTHFAADSNYFDVEPGQTYSYWYSAFDDENYTLAANTGNRGAGITGSLKLSYTPTPSCDNLYLISESRNAIYDISSLSGGSLTSTSTNKVMNVSTGANASLAVGIDPNGSGQNIWVTTKYSSSGYVYVNNTATSVTSPGYGGLTANPVDGKVYSVKGGASNARKLYQVYPSYQDLGTITGDAFFHHSQTYISTDSFFDSDGKYYVVAYRAYEYNGVWTSPTKRLYSIDLNTRQATFVKEITGIPDSVRNFQGLAFYNGKIYLLAQAAGSTNARLYEVNPDTGAASLKTTYTLPVDGDTDLASCQVYTPPSPPTDNCVTGDCNLNTFINAVDPNTLEYDNMVSVFHSSMVREADGTIRIWGQGAMPNGYSNGSSTGSVGNVLTPIEVSPANGYNYSGKILRFTAGSNQYNQQFAILTTDGLYSWGDEGVLLHADLQPRGVFTKLAVGTYGIAGTKADGLPDGVNPEDVKMLFGMRNGMAIVTCTGEAWVLSNITQLYGDGITSGSANQVWHRVSTAANTPLENVVAIRGAYRNMVALTASGELYTWGYSTLLGDGSANAPRTYATLMTKPAGVTPKMIGMTRSASSHGGEMSYYLLATDGKLYSMGANDKRQLGNGTTTSTTTWGEVTATDLATGATLGGNIVWLSSQEHDGNEAYPAVSVLTDQGKLWAWGTNDGNMLGIPGGDHTGNNPTYIPGRTTGAYDETKLNESDEVIAVETGGHTSIIIKKCTIKFGYVGHRINGSMADGTTDAANEGIYNFSETSQLAVCGALTSPKIPELLEICPEEYANLTEVQTILPAEVTGIHWYHDINAAVPVSNPSEVGPGTYYAFYELAGGTIHDCPSRLVVSYYAYNDPNTPCYCVEPGIPGEPDGYTKVGISTMKSHVTGWPENIPNGWITMDSKTKGMVITRVAHVGGTDGTPDSTDAITDAKEGMLVYDIQDECVKLYNGTIWNCIGRSCND